MLLLLCDIHLPNLHFLNKTSKIVRKIKENQKSGPIFLFEVVFGMYLQIFRAKYDDFMKKIPKYNGTYSKEQVLEPVKGRLIMFKV